MARTNTNGTSPTMSMADFNDRAKRVLQGKDAPRKAEERRAGRPQSKPPAAAK